jgi:SAM-dependent methyltransferase
MTPQPHVETLEKEEVAKHFSSISQTYNRKNYFLAGGRALEVGCGSGEMLCELMARGFSVVGIDLSTGMVQATRALVAQRLPDRHAEIQVGDVEQLGFADGIFDVVIAAGVIEYLAEDEKALAEVHRVLKPNGTLIFSVHNLLHLGRPITTARDLLRMTPVIGSGVARLSRAVRHGLKLAPGNGIPGRRHAPAALRRKLRRMGFTPQETVFYHFNVTPRFLKRQCPETCIRWEEKLEAFSRTPLGYFANQFIIRAKKTSSHADRRS